MTIYLQRTLSRLQGLTGIYRELNPGISDILVGLAFLVIIGGIATTYESWIGHAIIAIIGLVLMISALATGAMLKGRIKSSLTNIIGLHKRIGIYLGSFILGSFIYGIWMMLQHRVPILSSVHGRVGLIILLIMILQILPSLVLKDRRRYRVLHRLLGYLLAPILIIDTAWGLHNGLLAGTKSLVLLHSISGGLAALAFVWIILELMYPGEKGIVRARIASFIATFLVTVGCWIVGGYNYLINYGTQVKPIILAGREPWAHQIIMEAKEHIFIFLPIIAAALSLTIYFMDGDRFLNDLKFRRSLFLIACMTLFMVLIMFLMGAVISYAGSLQGGDLQ